MTHGKDSFQIFIEAGIVTGIFGIAVSKGHDLFGIEIGGASFWYFRLAYGNHNRILYFQSALEKCRGRRFDRSSGLWFLLFGNTSGSYDRWLTGENTQHLSARAGSNPGSFLFSGTVIPLNYTMFPLNYTTLPLFMGK